MLKMYDYIVKGPTVIDLNKEIVKNTGHNVSINFE